MTGEAGPHTDGQTATTSLRWPPPGLERMQGDLFGIAARGALAGGLLVLPLLFVAAREQDFATLGPFADAWWVTIVLSTFGLAFGLDAIARTARSLRRTARAVRSGYDLGTVARVLADRGKDMGFLMTGARHFSVMDGKEREGIAIIRVAAAVLLAGSGLWLIFALSIGLLFAARGVLSAAALQMMTLAPATIGYLFGGLAALIQEGRVSRARRVWFSHPWAEDLASEEIRDWQSTASSASDADLPPGGGGSPAVLAASGITLAVLAILVAVPVMTLVPTSAVGPILTSVSAPAVETYRPRAARTEAYRSYAVQGDVSISATEAGQLLQDLMYVGSDEEPSPGERPPSRTIPDPWLPELGEEPNPMGVDPYAWGDSLIERASRGLTAAQRAYLADVADHPAVPDFERLARATIIDVGSARWDLPFQPGMAIATMPIPRFSSIRAAANARIGAAALAMTAGRAAAAEEILAEVISVGFLLGDNGPTLVDNFIGYALIEAAGAALSDLYRETGQIAAAAELSRLGQVADRSAEMMRTELPQGTEAWVRALPTMVLDTTLVRGLRWEYFIGLATMAPCLNMHRMIFGADEDYAAFVEEARTSLVEWPSEEAIFEIARYGWAGVVEPGNPTLFGRFVGLYMSTEENSCGQLIRLMQAGAVF